jgi:hypothetical protein
MSILINPVLAEYVHSLDHDIRIKQCERRSRRLTTAEHLHPTILRPARPPCSWVSQVRSITGMVLVRAGTRLQGTPATLPRPLGSPAE